MYTLQYILKYAVVHYGIYRYCEGVSITQRNNSAVLGFARSYSHNGKSRFLKSLSGVLRKIFTIDSYYQMIHRIKIWGKSEDQILRNRGSKFKICPPISRKRGQLGVKIFIPHRGPRGLLIEILGSGNFYKGDPL